jgi:hypothetical protein
MPHTISSHASTHEAEAPLAITVNRACQLSGLGQTSVWSLLRTGRLEAVRVPGVRRTLISYRSLTKLLASAPAPDSQPRRKRRRPRKFSGTVGGAI